MTYSQNAHHLPLTTCIPRGLTAMTSYVNTTDAQTMHASAYVIESIVDYTHRLYILRVLRSSAPLIIVFNFCKQDSITRRDAQTCSAPRLSYWMIINTSYDTFVLQVTFSISTPPTFLNYIKIKKKTIDLVTSNVSDTYTD